MRTKNSLISFFACLFLAANSFGIGRIGNGKISDLSLGFSAEVPAQFVGEQLIGENHLRLLAPAEFLSEIQYIAHIEILAAATIDPSLRAMSRAETLQHLTSLGWRVTANQSGNPCVETLEYTGGNVIAAFALWGSGKGVLLRGYTSISANEGRTRFLDTLEVDAGACAWK